MQELFVNDVYRGRYARGSFASYLCYNYKYDMMHPTKSPDEIHNWVKMRHSNYIISLRITRSFFTRALEHNISITK